MKTNQLLSVSIGTEHIEAWHKTGMVSLTDLFRAGNIYRGASGVSPANQSLFIQSAKTQEFINVIKSKRKLNDEQIYSQTGRGKSSKTFVCLHLAVYAAEYLSAEFHYDVIDAFINGKILEWRDESGENFKDLNTMIKLTADKVLGKPSHVGHYTAIAKLIKSRINPDGDSWNTASADQLRARTKLEEKLTTFLEAGVVKDWEHLKELAAKL